MPIFIWPTYDETTAGQLLTGLDRGAGWLGSPVLSVADGLLSGFTSAVSGRGYFVYIGRTTAPITPTAVGLSIRATALGGVTSAEVGFFSTPLANNGATQTMTKIVSATVDISSIGFCRNGTPMAVEVAANVHLWAGFRAAGWLITAPTFNSLLYDHQIGAALYKSGATAFSSVSTETTTLYGAVDPLCGPDLRALF